jgi:aminomethyltransferase
MGNRTSLYQQHVDAGAKIVDFSGWEMPINYGSQIEEHNQVRTAAGVFDVSHMTVVDVTGSDAQEYLRHLLANDVARLDEVGRALYSGMLNEDGGVIDDLIVYRLQDGYRLVVNCATRTKDLRWMALQTSGYAVAVQEKPQLGILAVHGPESIERVCAVLENCGRNAAAETAAIQALGNFRGVELDDWFVARTGYTGEKGLEIILPATEAPQLWDALLAGGVKPIGLGARDTLRLEAGMNLYGHDMDDTVSPLSANMGFSIAWEPNDRDFVGRAALIAQRAELEAGRLPVLTGLVLEQRGVLREGLSVLCKDAEGNALADGVITSGTFSPTLKHSIALARVPALTASCEVDLRGTATPVRQVKPNFVRMGKKVFE